MSDTKPAKAKPTHYKTYCFSMYTEDAARLDEMVAALKRRGWTKASKSHLIRIALSKLDAETMEIPKCIEPEIVLPSPYGG